MHDAGADVLATAAVVNVERLSKRARDALADAQAAAQQCHHAAVDAPHVLLGILRRPDSKGGAALRQAGLVYRDVLVEVRETGERGSDAPAAPLALTADAEALLGAALREAQSQGEEFVETVHLALACSRTDAPPSIVPFVAGHERAIREAAQRAVRDEAAVRAPRAARSLRERREALEHANEERVGRAYLKCHVARGRVTLRSVLLDPAGCIQDARVLDLLLAVPGCGRARAFSLMSRCAISPTTTIAQLTEQQRRMLIDPL